MHLILQAKQVSTLKQIHFFLFRIQTHLQVHSLRRTIKERPGAVLIRAWLPQEAQPIRYTEEAGIEEVYQTFLVQAPAVHLPPLA